MYSRRCSPLITGRNGIAKSVMPQSAFRLTCGLPVLPFLVVMTMTPFAAREPYREAAAASLMMVMLSMSLVFRVDMMSRPASPPATPMSPLRIGMPSTT